MVKSKIQFHDLLFSVFSTSPFLCPPLKHSSSHAKLVVLPNWPFSLTSLCHSFYSRRRASLLFLPPYLLLLAVKLSTEIIFSGKHPLASPSLGHPPLPLLLNLASLDTLHSTYSIVYCSCLHQMRNYLRARMVLFSFIFLTPRIVPGK